MLWARKGFANAVFYLMQADADGDGIGDVCVGDTDSDFTFDYQVSFFLSCQTTG